MYHFNVLLGEESQLVLHALEGVSQLLVFTAQSLVLVQQRLVLALSFPKALELGENTNINTRAHTHMHTGLRGTAHDNRYDPLKYHPKPPVVISVDPTSHSCHWLHSLRLTSHSSEWESQDKGSLSPPSSEENPLHRLWR